MHSRRQTLAIISATLAPQSLPFLSHFSEAQDPAPRHIATNGYPWMTFAKRSNQPWNPHSDDLLNRISQTGITGYEPIVNGVSELNGLNELLTKHNLQMRSLYVNCLLHDPDKADASANDVISIAKAAYTLGAKIIVTNPAPIRWGGLEDKSDAQLQLQAKMLNQLGSELNQLGLTLAYHNHDAELRMGAREFHHMLTATDPTKVKFCLDAHWIYRGCGDSEVAVFDAVQHYNDRIVELHLRQSRDGVWTEAFSMNGDIDYGRLFQFLSNKNIQPHLVLEQAVEARTPHTLSVIEAHRQGYRRVRNATA